MCCGKKSNVWFWIVWCSVEEALCGVTRSEVIGAKGDFWGGEHRPFDHLQCVAGSVARPRPNPEPS